MTKKFSSSRERSERLDLSNNSPLSTLHKILIILKPRCYHLYTIEILGVKGVIFMKKFFYLIFVLALALIFITGCVQLPSVPQNVKSHVDDLIDKWNNAFGNVLEIVSWKYEGVIGSIDRLKEVLDSLTDPDSVRLVHTDITDPGSLSLLLLSAVPPDSQQEFADSVEDLIKTAQYLVKLNWRSVLSGEEFSSTLVLDDDGVVWESVIGSLVVEEVEILPAGKEKSGMVTIKWFWGSERGTIEWGVECDGPPLACSYSSKAQMASGEARIETHFVKSEECCTLYYGWAYRTPTGSISIEWNPETERFDIEVSSWGSTGSGQGIMECCIQ
jgi:hypothetical protein